MSSNPSCPFCGRSDWPEGPKFNGHKSYCKQHPETRPKPASPKGAPSEKSTSTSQASSTSSTTNVTATTGAGTSTVKLEPVQFEFTEGERLPSQQEIPEFKTPQQEKEEAKKGEPETVKATLAEERKAGVSAIAALIVPLFDMVNRVAAGEPAVPGDAKSFALTKDDAEMLAQAVILVDNKYGGPLTKTLGGDYGPELFLAGVSLGLGIKITMMFRLRMQKSRTRPSAAPSSEEIREKSPLERAGESLRNLITPQKKEEKKPEEEKPEGAMTSDKFMEYAKDYQDKAIVH